MKSHDANDGQGRSPHNRWRQLERLRTGFSALYRSLSAMASMIRSGEGFCDV